MIYKAAFQTHLIFVSVTIYFWHEKRTEKKCHVGFYLSFFFKQFKFNL